MNRNSLSVCIGLSVTAILIVLGMITAMLLALKTPTSVPVPTSLPYALAESLVFRWTYLLSSIASAAIGGYITARLASNSPTHYIAIHSALLFFLGAGFIPLGIGPLTSHGVGLDLQSYSLLPAWYLIVHLISTTLAAVVGGFISAWQSGVFTQSV